ncbi:alpha/beta hydrolase [Methanolapillus africanus]
MYYEDTGSGEPIIFLHGSLTRGAPTFAAQIQAFQPSNRCICPDLRGHGNTSCTDLCWTSELLADDVIELMNALDLPKAHIVGHSMGADVAMYCAVNYPKRVSSIVSISSAGAVNDSVITYMERFNPESIDMVKYGNLVETIQKEHFAAHGGNWQTLFNQSLANCYTYPDFTDDDFKKITAPFLLIYGSRDAMVKDYEVERLSQNISSFSCRLIEDCGHFPHVASQKCDVVNQMIMDFICQCNSSTQM